jgi:rare lipoprotein A
VAELQVRVIEAPDADGALYKKGRRYDPVPGYIGRYTSLEEAHAGMAAAMALEALASSVLAPLTGSAVEAARNDLDAAPGPAEAIAGEPSPAPETKVAEAQAGGEPKPAAEPEVATDSSSEQPDMKGSKVARSHAHGSRHASHGKSYRAGKKSNGVAVASARGTAQRPSKLANTAMEGPNDHSTFSRYAQDSAVARQAARSKATWRSASRSSAGGRKSAGIAGRAGRMG